MHDKSPYDGDWVYWGAQLGRYPTQSPRVLRPLKEQQGRCGRNGLRLTTEDVLDAGGVLRAFSLNGSAHTQSPKESIHWKCQ